MARHMWSSLKYLAMVMMIALQGENTAHAMTVAERSVPSSPVIAITHGAGRMGKLLALQLHERNPTYQIRSICQTPEEGKQIQLDLGGIKLVNGEMMPAQNLDWLDIMVVPPSEDIDTDHLQNSLQDVMTAVLCSASHNEVIYEEDGSFGVKPPTQGATQLSDRLVDEVKAALASPTIEHVILRSTMGLGKETPEALFNVMGGQKLLKGPKEAEDLLIQASNMGKKLSTTILRLGALTDDAGPIPLSFNVNDNMLLNRMQNQPEGSERVPLISRADAARLCMHCSKLTPPRGVRRVDVAWDCRYGAHSVRIEGVREEAVYQDLEGCLMRAAEKL